ncbi:MAG: hypothetical protein QOD40_3366 [Alphaproteobacteria bacterium]|jgi:hypothetical protein|nr:hypothetical protein [Alphaproteobacteria bacterium]
MNVDLSTVEAITRLAEQFGPFLFAVLFILVVTRTAHTYYSDCMTRKDPPPSELEQKTYRLYFVSSVCVGIAVMTLSIGWWFYVQSKGNHVYQVAILGLDPDETVLADYYFKQVQRPTVPGGKAEHDMYFLIVRDQPFRMGERFEFEYFKLPSAPASVGAEISGRTVEIKYGGSRSDTYRLIGGPADARLEVSQDETRPAEFFTAKEIQTVLPAYASADAPSWGRAWP